MRMFLRRPTLTSDPLPVTMSGVRRGERALQIGIDDAAIVGGIAAKVGISGQAMVVVADTTQAMRASRAAEDANALAEVHVGPLTALALPDASFDAIVIHSKSGWLSSLPPEARHAWLVECHRVLRPGGRVVALEAGTLGGWKEWLGGSKPTPGGSHGAADGFAKAGFKPVRVLADAEGYAFIEGLKG
jgi:ubiquinone/menaquinone biosynthesis C-methylase UbiE